MAKVLLDDDGFTVLGNALLLGHLVLIIELRNSDASKEERRKDRFYYPRRRELREVLELAGAYDRRIAGKTQIAGFTELENFRGWETRILELANSDADIATLRIKDIDFSTIDLAMLGLESALRDADPFELRMPLVEFGPTNLTELLEQIVKTYFQEQLPISSRLSPAAEDTVGIETIFQQRHLEQTSSWEAWNSPFAQEARLRTGWQAEMLAKASRHVSKPIEQEFKKDPADYNIAELGKQLVQHWSDLSAENVSVYASLGELGAGLSDAADLSQDALGKLFPSYGASIEHKRYEPNADPTNFLFFCLDQIAWRAVQRGWVLCIAEDGRDDQVKTWIAPDEFPVLAENDDLVLPDAIGVELWPEIEQRLQAALKADKLYFVLARDAAKHFADKPSKKPNRVENSKKEKLPKNFNRGLCDFDTPFVEEGLQMMANGDAKSANHAATLLVEIYGETTVNDLRPGEKTIRSQANGAAQGRLQKKIREAYKLLNNN